MLAWIAKLILHLLGWKAQGKLPDQLKKAVFLAAPHTSNWDAIFGLLGYISLKQPFKPVKFMAKKEVMVFPFHWLLNRLGVIAIDRQKILKGTSTVMQMVHQFNTHESLILGLSPEGTRCYNPQWKTGFYHIAQQAKVPIVLGYLDYKTKTAGIGPVFHLTGSLDHDLTKIQNFYAKKTGKYPQQGVLPIKKN